ncbi:hypothetical protein RRG08_047563 [Elysia crispata]|uniref:Uncharacterized protein n=1 Tax=Elysia crispata TaxID=231223 RepID=A0AAE1D245_9GAST|nr:hypothetical protein RRG08_047563 [Elysia crispata]
MGVKQTYIDYGCQTDVHRLWVSNRRTSTMGVKQTYIDYGCQTDVHRLWVSNRRISTMGVKQTYIDYGCQTDVHRLGTDQSDRNNVKYFRRNVLYLSQGSNIDTEDMAVWPHPTIFGLHELRKGDGYKLGLVAREFWENPPVRPNLVRVQSMISSSLLPGNSLSSLSLGQRDFSSSPAIEDGSSFYAELYRLSTLGSLFPL